MTEKLNAPSKGRGLFYVIAAGAGILALTGYADFDVQGCFLQGNCVLDIKPFDVKEFALTCVTTGGNLLAGLAVWKRWGK